MFSIDVDNEKAICQVCRRIKKPHKFSAWIVKGLECECI
jgi:hypothetical protein